MKNKKYVLSQEDSGKTLEIDGDNKEDTQTIVIPNQKNSSILNGSEVKIFRANEKAVKLEYENGVELKNDTNDNAPFFFVPKFTEIQIRKRALNEWVLEKNGDFFIPSFFAEGGDEVFEEEIFSKVYRIHAFTNIGENLLDVISGPGEVDILIVAGGGEGGVGANRSSSLGGGGGGAGGVVFVEKKILSVGSNDIYVGDGGKGVASFGSEDGGNGQNSYFNNFIAIGGGGGGTRLAGEAGRDGGSGGGGSYQSLAGASIQDSFENSRSFGNSGGSGSQSTPWISEGGGGGAGGRGRHSASGASAAGPSESGEGGIGLDFSGFFGKSIGHDGWFGGGGGGGASDGSSGFEVVLGGLGGGGNGGLFSSPRAPGQDAIGNTGGGGGGGPSNGGGSSSNVSGGNGGSGIVLVRYRIG